VEKCEQKASTDPSTQECVEGTTEGSPDDPSGTYAHDRAKRVRDPGDQEGNRISGKDTHVHITPISGTMNCPSY
jgi:hypothetical protein